MQMLDFCSRPSDFLLTPGGAEESAFYQGAQIVLPARRDFRVSNLQWIQKRARCSTSLRSAAPPCLRYLPFCEMGLRIPKSQRRNEHLGR